MPQCLQLTRVCVTHRLSQALESRKGGKRDRRICRLLINVCQLNSDLRQKVATCLTCTRKVLGDLEEKENWSNFLAISVEQGLEINLPYIYLKALFSS